MHQVGFGRKREVFNMKETHAEPPFPCDYVSVEKRKISYFGLALNLFQHLISPNRNDLSYSARTFISG